LVDGETGEPVVGAVVYGYYATQGGTRAGGKVFGELLRSFEAVSDGRGVFELAPWSTAGRVVEGVGMTLFPVLVIYAPGYDMDYDGLMGVEWWRPRLEAPAEARRERTAEGEVIDWTHAPHRMRRARTLAEEASALADSGFGIQFIGACGWEAYARTLVVRHNALHGWMDRAIPPEARDERGYLRSGFFPENMHTFLNLYKPSVLDQVLDAYAKDPQGWPCADPRKVFGRVKGR
jgi:hypothetical protein